jgi:UDP-N-acetylenolpyruvoylglucosamine reductase
MGVLESSKNVFIVGIKGVAMAGLARMLTQMGKQVTGSDTSDPQITYKMLSELRIANSELTDVLPIGVDLVVYSAAHGGSESSQVKEAQNRAIAVVSQAGLIAEIIKLFPVSIAICGCHGKTTTSAQTAFILHELGAKVSWLVGAPYFKQITNDKIQISNKIQNPNDKSIHIPNIETIVFPGGHFEKDSEIFVFEADEYGVCPPFDKTPKILLYYPTHIVCTNIDFDHPDIYRDINHVRSTFTEFFSHAKHVYESNSTSLENNMVGVLQCLKDMGYDENAIRDSMEKFRGVARRLEDHGEEQGIKYYDDYAHHPAEIKVTIDEMRKLHPGHRLIVLFQSHTYSRTQALKDAFIEVLSKADIALIDEIFPSAREKEEVLPITAKDLELLAKSKGFTNIKGFSYREELIRYTKNIVKSGDVVITVGAGDIYKAIPNVKIQMTYKNSNDSNSNNLIRRDFSIGDKFTWKVQTTSKYYTEIQNEDELKRLVGTDEFKNSKKRYILGRGANTLFASKEYDGLVIEINTKGIEKIREDSDYAYWRVAAGEDWVELVEKMVLKENLGGLENLAYIPGKVGSAPIQNIAAYGEAFEDVCKSVEYIDLSTLEHQTCGGKECQFSYRNSKFKNMLKTTEHGFVIWSVVLKLAKPSKHTIESGYFSNYESLQSELTHLEGRRPTIQDIYHAVVSLRKKKLPEVSEVGTNGSLFMNPIIKGSKVIELLKRFPKLQYYPTEKMKYVPNSKLEIINSKQYKIAAGHIFDEIGWKGKLVGKVGTWKKHALVLCNYGTQDPGDIIKVIRMMQDDFEKATGIRLEPEINIVE